MQRITDASLKIFQINFQFIICKPFALFRVFLKGNLDCKNEFPFKWLLVLEI